MRISVREYARLANISQATAYRHVDAGKVASTKVDDVTYVILGDSEMQTLEAKQGESAEMRRLAKENQWLRGQVEALQGELSEMRKRSDSLLMQAQGNIADITQQLSRSTKHLEDRRQDRVWWQVWRRA